MWYKHTLTPLERTWDWAWTSNTQYPIEFNFSLNNLFQCWIVVTFAGFSNVGETMNNHVYLNISSEKLPMYWQNTWLDKYVQSTNVDPYAFHSQIDFYEHSILWNGITIYTF